MFHQFHSHQARDRDPLDGGEHRHGRRFARSEGPWDQEGGGRHGRHGHEGRGHFGRGHTGRGGRMFDHGQLRLVILKLIADKPSHGYELIKEIEERLGGGYSPSPGVIYPALTLLEELGHASVVSNESGRKLYTVTEAGQAFLDASKPQVDAALARMNAAGKSRISAQAPQILRAMENLKMALRLKLSQGALAESEIVAIAAVLDAAALQVESAKPAAAPSQTATKTPATSTQIEEGN